MLVGELSVNSRLSLLHPQLTRSDLAAIARLRAAKEYSDWNALYCDLLDELGIDIPTELRVTE
jgi:hypothetical protein